MFVCDEVDLGGIEFLEAQSLKFYARSFIAYWFEWKTEENISVKGV